MHSVGNGKIIDIIFVEEKKHKALCHTVLVSLESQLGFSFFSPHDHVVVKVRAVTHTVPSVRVQLGQFIGLLSLSNYTVYTGKRIMFY